MSVVLVGLLAEPAMLDALGLAGQAGRLPGQLAGGAQAGLEAGAWPLLAAGPGDLASVAVGETPALSRYAEVMGARALDWQGARVLGAGGPVPAVRAEAAPEAAPVWDAPLAAEIARQILAAPAHLPAAQLAARLPMIGTWAASRLRAADMPVSGGGLVRRRGADEVQPQSEAEDFTGYFAVRRPVLRHSRHDGTMSGPLSREIFVMGDAVVVLPWDPVRDTVLLIEQFRPVPWLRGDPQPWLLEAVAGRVDAGESPAEAARREAREEADLTLTRLIPAFDAYPSPGAVGEFHHYFVGIADLPEGTGGIHGLDQEAEDIRGLVLPRAQLTRMVLDNQVPNAPLAMIALWLDRQAPELARGLAQQQGAGLPPEAGHV